MTQSDAVNRNRLLEQSRTLLRRRPFRPHRLLASAHLQTVISSKRRRSYAWGWRKSQSIRLELSGGAHVRVVVVEQDPGAPTLVAFHGLGGSSDSNYMQGLSHKAYREGWNSALVNLQDENPRPQQPVIFHSGVSALAEEIITRLQEAYRWTTLFLFGASMGGNILLKLLGEWGSGRPPWISAAGVISPLVDMTTTWTTLEDPRNLIYRIHFVSYLRRSLRRRAAQLTPFIDMEAALGIRSVRDFDEIVTAPLSGFRDAVDYYQRASAAPQVPRIRVPTLVLHAKDDPLIPWEPWNRPALKGNRQVLIHLTRQGGHVGFVEQERLDIDRAWAENRVIDYFRLVGRI